MHANRFPGDRLTRRATRDIGQCLVVSSRASFAFRVRAAARGFARVAVVLPSLLACGENRRHDSLPAAGSAGRAPEPVAGEGGHSEEGGGAGGGGQAGDGTDRGQAGSGAASGKAGRSGSDGVGGREPQAGLETLPVAALTLDEDDSDGAIIALGGFDASSETPQQDLIVLIEQGPRHGTLSDESGRSPLATRYTPNQDFAGSDTFQFVVADLEGRRSAPREVSLEILPVNDAPIASDDVFTTDSLTPVRIDVTANDTDVDDAELTLVGVTQPERGAVSIIEGGAAVLFTPRHPNSGRETFRYTVEDSAGASDTATVELTVLDAALVSIESFSAEPTEVEAGTNVTLTWISVNATSCSISGGVDIGGAASGSVEVTPDGPILYTLQCLGPGGPVSRSTAVVVLERDAPDSDGDGVSDAVEALTGTDAADPDSDDDGVPDGSEDLNGDGGVDAGETDPREPDSDLDGFCDGLRVDGDGDGIGPTDDCLGPVLVDGANTALEQDGKTWSTAYADIQQAVDAALEGGAVWVKVGRYRAASANATVLALRDSISVYGGFAGVETYLAARDPASRGSVLDGDFAADDTSSPALDAANPAGNPAANRSDNSYHVVYGANDARLDGFSIEHGHATASGTIPGGGGLLALHSGLVVANSTFAGNSAVGAGGAVLCTDRCELTIEASTFSDNRAVTGGALEASPTLTEGPRVLVLSKLGLSGNWALSNGGAIATRGGVTTKATALECSSNTAVNFGGCWYNQDSSVHVEGGDFSANGAYEGAGIYNHRLDFSLNDANFTNNVATRLGGGVLNYQGTVEITDSALSFNSAGWGGSICSFTATTVVEGTSIANSAATNAGGAVYADVSSTVRLSNATLLQNTARWGGGVYVAASELIAEDSSFESNNASESGAGAYSERDAKLGLASVRFSNGVSKFGGGMTVGDTELELENCAFLTNTGTIDGGGLYLWAGSQATLEGLDMRENFAKDQGGGIYVTDAGYRLTDSVFSGNRANNTGGGIFQWVEVEGTLERVAFVRNVANFGMGAMIFGPGSVVGSNLAFVANSGNAGSLQVDAETGPTRVSVRDAAFWRNKATVAGAGMLVLSDADPALANVTFAENTCADGEGAALFAVGGLPILTNATFLSNSARAGGAIAATTHPETDVASEVRLTNASFLDNRATVEGGGVFTSGGSSATIRNSVFWGGSGTDPDVHDPGPSASRSHVAASTLLTGSGNLALPGDPFEVVQPGGRVFLNQSLSTPPSALDAGLDAFADDPEFGFQALGLSAWQELSTAADGRVDASSVDLGRHHAPAAAAITSFSADAASYSWATINVDSCLAFNDVDTSVVVLDSPAGSEPASFPSGSELTLVCFGATGEPAVAFATVP
jgi:predicted outer membrane repeat protein